MTSLRMSIPWDVSSPSGSLRLLKGVRWIFPGKNKKKRFVSPHLLQDVGFDGGSFFGELLRIEGAFYSCIPQIDIFQFNVNNFTGVIKWDPFWGGSKLMQNYGIFKWFPLNSVLFGLVSYNDPCFMDSFLVSTRSFFFGCAKDMMDKAYCCSWYAKVWSLSWAGLLFLAEKHQRKSGVLLCSWQLYGFFVSLVSKKTPSLKKKVVNPKLQGGLGKQERNILTMIYICIYIYIYSSFP